MSQQPKAQRKQNGGFGNTAAPNPQTPEYVPPQNPASPPSNNPQPVYTPPKNTEQGESNSVSPRFSQAPTASPRSTYGKAQKVQKPVEEIQNPDPNFIPDLEFEPNETFETRSPKQNLTENRKAARQSIEDPSLAFLAPQEQVKEPEIPDLSGLSKSLLIREITKNFDFHCQEFNRQMETRESAFATESSQHKDHSGSVGSDFHEKEKKDVFEQLKQRILRQAQQFSVDDPENDFSSVEIPDPKIGAPSPSGFGRVYASTAKSAVEGLSFKYSERTIESITKILKLEPSMIMGQFTPYTQVDWLKEIQNLYNESKCQASENVINLNLAETKGTNLVEMIAKCIITAAKTSARVLFKSFSILAKKSTIGARKLSELCTCIEQADELYQANQYGECLLYSSLMVQYLLTHGVLSDLFKMLSRSTVWKKDNYYIDSPLLSNELCEQLGHLMMQIESSDFVNSIKKINDAMPALSAKQWESRIQGAVRDYYSTSRQWLMDGSFDSDPKKQNECVASIIRLVAHSILTQGKSGEILKFDALWDLLLNASQEAPRFITVNPARKEGEKNEFQKFCAIVDEAKSTGTNIPLLKGTVPPMVRALYVFVKCFNNHIIAYLPLFCSPAAKRTRGFDTSVIANDADALRISGALFLMNSPNFNLEADEIKEFLII